MKIQLIQFSILFIQIFFKLLFWAIFIHILLSWFAQGRTQFGVWIDRVVQPVLWPFRWVRIGPVDLSPIVAFLVLDWVSRFLVGFLAKFLA